MKKVYTTSLSYNVLIASLKSINLLTKMVLV
jgi:hypothetical protein